jgi:heavy metal translocating P-type ATPase
MTKIEPLMIISSKTENIIAALSLLGIGVYLVLQYVFDFGQAVYTFSLNEALTPAVAMFYQGQQAISIQWVSVPLILVLVLGGIPLVCQLSVKLLHADFGADLLAGISIVTAVLLDEYLAGSLVVLMLSGGAALEHYAVRKASSVLEALAKRMPSAAHRKSGGQLIDITTEQVNIGDTLLVLPHEICPVDGTVLEGRGTMDESYLTGEPYMMSKTTGSSVMSGAINGDSALTIHADKLSVDSRYAKIMEVMRSSEQYRPNIRRLGDQLGALYTPLAVIIALAAWAISGDVVRFLAVLVVATPCPLLIGIPVTIISSISLAARREIIIKNPAILETIGTCRTAIFDKTGTLTYGRPTLTGLISGEGYKKEEILTLIASLERYSKHPLSSAIVKAAEKVSLSLLNVTNITELPGDGLKGTVTGKQIQITSRKKIIELHPTFVDVLPPILGGLECIVLIDDNYAATLQFRDEVRIDSSSFITHLGPNHLFERVMLVSGDRESEVRYLADKVGIEHVYYSQSPEQKLELVRAETKVAKTIFLGDGINDAPSLTAATIGIAFGQNSDITGESADAVIMDSSLLKVDELFHIGERMRKIALQSAVGGMALSSIGMVFAGLGYLTPVAGAVTQEVIDVLAVLNALRAAVPPKSLSDFLKTEKIMSPTHSEVHRTHRIGWLRAAVLGANDGIVSTASLILGIAATHATHNDIVLTGIAGLVAGSMAMAAGEYVSVSSQADTEQADLLRESKELDGDEQHEKNELASIYVSRGLDPALAEQVAEQLMRHDALGAHARDELGISATGAARPIQAALASAATFAVGAALPLLIVVFAPVTDLIVIVSSASLLFLVLLGVLAAYAGGAGIIKGAFRVAFWGALAMGLTAAVGSFFGTVV